ncbi:MAG: glycerol kinase GlpK [Pseudomonadota bacterium]
MLAIDQGTSSSRAIVFRDGQIAGLGQVAFDMHFPQPGWVEQDPEVLWRTTQQAIAQALAAAGVDPGAVAAIGITNQRETTLLWERDTGRCLHPAIVWQDRRTADLCAQLAADGASELVRDRSGLVIDPYFSATKLRWLLDALPGERARAERGELCFGTVDSFLIWRLTGGARHVTDATNAARTQLYDIRAGDWSDDLLDLHRVPRAVLPEVLDCVADFGATTAEVFGARVPIRGVAGDQQAALIGQACFEPGMTKSTYGTGCFLIANTGTEFVRSGADLLTTVGYRLAGVTTFALEGSIFNAGVAVKWLRDQLGLIDSAATTEDSARATNGDTGGCYVVPAFTGLGAPHWDPLARGLISGLTLDTSRDQVVTATLASMAYQTHDLLQALQADAGNIDTVRIDGGMVVNDWLCQFLADVLDTVVERPRITETTAFGAAMLAGIGVGAYADVAAAGGSWQTERRFEPGMSAQARDALLAGWRVALRQALQHP